MEQRKLNFSISDGVEFYAHEVTINYNPSQFIFDFKCITPRTDPRSQQAPHLAIKHNVVMLDVYHAHKLHELMGGIIERYEKEYGKIRKPKAIEVAEKRKTDEKKVEHSSIPSYFG
jgi:Protein of unknown function (DUF3467)